nr:proline-rich receptor-like protein kinase PERK8 [Penaeus vannamei]
MGSTPPWPHKCQVYHNCLFGQRYDFLCANYTVFDQKNFICHYVSEVDCVNSAKHYDRNDELYETTTTTTTTPPPPQIIYVERPRPLANRLRPNMNRPQRPTGPRPGKRPKPPTPPRPRPSTTTTTTTTSTMISTMTTTTTTTPTRGRPPPPPPRPRGRVVPSGRRGPAWATATTWRSGRAPRDASGACST